MKFRLAFNPFLRAFAVYFLVVCAPKMAGAQGKCFDIFKANPILTMGTPDFILYWEPMPIGALNASMGQSRLIWDIYRTGNRFFNENGVLVKAYAPKRFIRIVPGPQSELNRLAIYIKSKYDADLIYDAGNIARRDDSASMGTYINERGEFNHALFISMEALTNGVRPTRQRPILHELRHFQFMLELIKKIPSSYYGNIFALDGFIIQRESYARQYSFEELKTFHAQVKQEMIVLRGMIREGSATVDTFNQSREILELARFLKILANKSTDITNALISLAKKNPSAIEWRKFGEIIYAEASGVHTSSATIAIDIPILSVTRTNSAERIPEFIKQMEWTARSAATLRQQAEAIEALLHEIKPFDQNQTAEQRVQLVDQIQSLLKPIE